MKVSFPNETGNIRNKAIDYMIDKDIFLKVGLSFIKLDLKKIIYFEALENHVILNYNKEKFTIRFNLNAIENLLPSESFIRIHPSFIVNRSMIQTINERSLDINVGDTLKNLPFQTSSREFLLTETLNAS